MAAKLTFPQVRATGHGRGRAAFWRALGFPNCQRATAARMEKRRLAKEQAEQVANEPQTAAPVAVSKPRERL